MRIIGGTSRGRRLSGPSGAAIRPTADQVKEALFNILADRIVGVRFLDLFAGTGNIGLEALSRRATQATFVESNPTVCRLLEANVRRCGFERVAEIHPVPVSRFLKHARGLAYDIIFLDPPYQTRDAQRVLPSLGSDAIIPPHGVVVVEHFHKTHLNDRIGHLVLVKTYRYGDTCLSVYQRDQVEASA
jgi:16S rRNA (guanine(966)-N(2))-methyltransferase RsmD